MTPLRLTIKQLFGLVVGLTTLIYLSSCDKLPENGALDGQWQWAERHIKPTPETAGYPEYHNMLPERVYWRFQLRLLDIVSDRGRLNGHSAETLARFRHADGRLALTETYIRFALRDSLLTDPETSTLVPLGIYGNATTFDIIRLDNDRMILRSPHDSLVFRKF